MPKYINPYTDFLRKEHDDYERSRLSGSPSNVMLTKTCSGCFSCRKNEVFASYRAAKAARTALHLCHYRLSYIGFKQATDTARKDGIEEGIEQGIAMGIEKGIEQGMEKGKREAVIGLYENGIPIEMIAKSLQISEEKVSEIISIHTKK
ncbi:MAG: hypothetical protein ACKVTZ_10420 [Bacteroidia bacterium]